MSIIQGNTKVSAAGGYTIDQSVRFNDDDSAYLNRTPGSASDRKKWTWSGWLKRGALTTTNVSGIFSATSGTNQHVITFNDSNGGKDTLEMFLRNSGGALGRIYTPSVFRDSSAWYHCVFVFDSANATAADRMIIYVNGVRQTVTTATTLAQNTDGWVNYTYQHDISRAYASNTYLYDGYMAEINFIDGQALAPTDFGETNDDGVWIPKQYAGTYGTNGFYITGADSADLGADYSGNGNDFTSSGLTSDDQMLDTPTDNYPVISPIDRQSGASAPLSDGNLKFTNNNTGTAVDARATFAVSSGKWYWEIEADILGQSGVARENVGVVSPQWRIDSGTGGTFFTVDPTGYGFGADGQKRNNNVASAYGSSWTAGDIIGVALDLDNGKIWWSLNGTFQNSGNPAAGTGEAYSGLSGTYAPAFSVDYGTGVSQIIANFGQTGGLTYTPPTGFSALSTANLPEPTIKDGSAHFNNLIYTGDGTTSRTITGVGFQPDLVWIKCRSTTESNILTDAVRGIAAGRLKSDSTAAEESQSSTPTATLSGFDSDGFIGPSSTPGNINVSSRTYVARNWLAGNGTAQNADGSITSTVSVNQTAGFSIVSYTGNGSSGATVGHGLGVTPKTVIVKPRSAADNWLVSNWEPGITPFTEKLKLNATDAASSSATQVNAGSSTTFTLGTDSNVNGNGTTYIAYCWSEVDGFSKFGKYIGNGSADGPFVWCGFRPAFVIVKNVSQAVSWGMFDNKRIGYNVDNFILFANNTNAETTTQYVDFLSNGFKLRRTGTVENVNGNTHIFLAFAENPFGGSNVAPVPAR